MSTTRDLVNENLKRASFEMMILRFLKDEDCYGYDLKQKIAEKSGGAVSLTDCVLYPPLYRMIKSGYISEHKEIVCTSRVRVYYHIEPAGEKRLEELSEAFRDYVRGVYKIMDWGKKV